VIDVRPIYFMTEKQMEILKRNVTPAQLDKLKRRFNIKIQGEINVEHSTSKKRTK